MALLACGTFAHKKIADAFQREYGLTISCSFKMNRCVGYLQYLMDIDMQPAKYPEELDLQAKLKSQNNCGEVESKASKARPLPAPKL